MNNHDHLTKSLELSKHRQNNNIHCFTWTGISNALEYTMTRKNLETYALLKPGLNEEKDFERSVLFKNDVTESN